MTVYRALYMPKHSGGPSGVFGLAPIDDIDKKKIVSIVDRKFKFQKFLPISRMHMF